MSRHRQNLRRSLLLTLITVAFVSGIAGCGAQAGSSVRNNLNAMKKGHITIKGTSFEVWLALSPDEQQLGLMQVTEDQLAPTADGAQRGMLFVFPHEQNLAFWMYNTIIPLDIAYIRDDGRIVKTYTMAPLETRTYPSVEPARYALEVRAGLLAELNIGVGDQVEIPDSLLKDTP